MNALYITKSGLQLTVRKIMASVRLLQQTFRNGKRAWRNGSLWYASQPVRRERQLPILSYRYANVSFCQNQSRSFATTGIQRRAAQSQIVGEDNVLRCPFQDSMAPVPEGSIVLHVMKALEDNADKVALIDGVTGEELTSKDLQQRGMKVASGLKRRGFAAGDVLCILSPNTIHYPAVFLGATLNGGIVSLANPAYNADEFEHIVRNSGATWIAVGAGLEKTALEVAQRVGNIKEIFLFEGQVEGCSLFQELLDDTGDQYVPHTQVDPVKDVVVLPYSSGTTGLPKGVMVTHRNLAAAFMQFRDPRTLGLDGNDVMMLFLPFFHSLGFIMMFSSLINDYKAVMLPRFIPDLFLKVIQEHKVSCMAVVPPVVLFLAQSPAVDKYDLTSLRRMYCAAAPLSADVQEAVIKRLGGSLELCQGYGMTESVACISLCSQENKLGSIGQLSGYMELKIVDVETREPLGPNQEGEICINGPQITPGYYKNQKATDETFAADGWLKTGDVGYFDDEGFLYIVDRLKELIKYKGLQVAPAELEGLLLQHEDIIDAAVVGKKHDRYGELPTAFVVKKPGSQVTAEDVQHFIASKVSNHKHLHGGVVFMDAIPKNASGKILRKDIKKMAEQL